MAVEYKDLPQNIFGVAGRVLVIMSAISGTAYHSQSLPIPEKVYSIVTNRDSFAYSQLENDFAIQIDNGRQVDDAEPIIELPIVKKIRIKIGKVTPLKIVSA